MNDEAKWTRAAVQDMLARLEQSAKEEGIYYLGQALVQHRITRNVWTFWKTKYAGDTEIIEHTELIESILENKLLSGALQNKLPAAVAIFALKSNHQWTDRPQADHSKQKPATGSTPIVITFDDDSTITVP